jgi:hypothetical protein
MQNNPNMDDVLFRYNPISNDDLLKQINNKYSIDEFFLYTIFKNIRDINDDDPMKANLIDNFLCLFRTVPGNLEFFLGSDVPIEDIVDEYEWV